MRNQCPVPHPFAFFLAKGWEAANPGEQALPISMRRVASRGDDRQNLEQYECQGFEYSIED